MKILIISILFLMLSCNSKRQPNNIKSERKQNNKEFFSLLKNTDLFEIENNPLFEEIDITSDSLEGQYKNTKVKDKSIIDLIRSKENVYSLYYYSPAIKQENITLYFVTGGWDYNESIYLVTKQNETTIDYIDIAYRTGSVNGGGFDHYLKKTEYESSKLISDFNEWFISNTCPIDTIIYYKKGKTRIWIDKEGKIHEDTLEVKRNFQVLKKNSDCD